MGLPLRVLFVEDRPDDALLLERELRRGGYSVEATRVETEAALRTELQTEQWDLIISDYSMPQFNALRALEVFKESGLDLPFIIVSGTIGEDVAVAVLKGGAHDFIPKGTLQRLLPAIERELREAESRRERRLAEEELRTKNEVIAAVFTASPVPMILLDENAHVLRWNCAAERVFGWSAGETVGRPLRIVPESEIERHRSLLKRVFQGEHLSNQEIVRVRKDGSLTRILVSAAPIKGSSNQTTSVLGILVDVTEQRNLEEQLRQAQKMEAVGRLAGGIAHDFNNVLTAIQGYANLVIADTPETDERRSDLLEILQAADRAASFTRQLLAFSRKQITQPVHTDLNGLIANMEKLLARVIGDHIRIEFEPSTQPQYVYADKGQLEQVILNLAVNARDALPAESEGRIVLRTYCELLTTVQTMHNRVIEPGSYCVLEVEDNGSGIPAENLDRIFDPFFTTKDVGKGTGLGLSTVYGIAQQNNGFIRVKSAVGAGTTFSVFLPESTAEPDTAVESAPPAVAVAHTNLCVLVVEDEAAIRNLITRVLRRAGYRVLAAADALEALQIMEGEDFDILLTDLMLPQMNGQELTRRVRERRPQVASIYMSGFAEEEIDAGMPYLEKPFTPADLLQKLQQINGATSA